MLVLTILTFILSSDDILKWLSYSNNKLLSYIFEKIDIEVLADKAKELEETSITAVVGGVDASEVGKSDSS